MHFLNLQVRRDWQEFELQRVTAYQKLWLIIQGLVILSVLTVFVLSEQAFSYPWNEVLRTIFSSVLYLLIPFWVIYRSGEKEYRKISITALIYIGAGVLSWFTYPSSLKPEMVHFSSLPVFFVLLVPLVSGMWVLIASQGLPQKIRALGLVADSWLLNILIGVAAGGMLGLHLLLTTILLPGSKFPMMPDGSALLWLLCFQVGLSALGEELLFRGLGFSLLFDGLKNPLWMVAIQLTVFNVLIYLVQAFISPTIIAGLIVVLYRLLLSLLNTAMRHQQGSLIPGLISNVILSTVLWIIVS
jgi:hypothetical protein